MLRFDHVKVKKTMIDVLEELGLNKDSIRHMTDSIVETSLRGVDSHGINLFPHYVNVIRSGRISKSPKFNVEIKTLTTAVLDADGALGHHAGVVAMEKAILCAKKNGMGAVAVKNSSHFGAAAHFGLMAAHEGCLGFSFTNADALVKATNAKESFFGTNPVCFAAPMAGEDPFCLDMATSTISWNKRNNYLRENRKLEGGWAFDKDGFETINPSDAVSLSPTGDYKGFGLGMMVDILVSVLAGSFISKDIKPMYGLDIKERRNIGHFFMAISIDGFSELDGFKERLKDMVDRVRSMEKTSSNDVLVPGDPEKKTKVIRLKSNIPVDEVKYQEFLNISKDFEKCLSYE
ncbi:MAG: Ldh family oxidoreductase [Gammaproteobacteria bacterium]